VSKLLILCCIVGIVVFIGFATACSATGSKKNCELECDDCQRVKFTCGGEDKTIEAGDAASIVT